MAVREDSASWRERAIYELDELRERIDKLIIFLDTSDKATDLHVKQLKAMQDYEKVLAQRSLIEGWYTA